VISALGAGTGRASASSNIIPEKIFDFARELHLIIIPIRTRSNSNLKLHAQHQRGAQ
jgi:hypothetical protein